MQIRQLFEADAHALHSLRIRHADNPALGRTHERAHSASLAGVLEDLGPTLATFGAYKLEDLVGAIAMRQTPANPILPEAPLWYGIASLIVHDSYRGNGLGRALVVHCIDRARELDAQGVLLEVNLPNPTAISLYRSLGFEIWNTNQRAYECSEQWFDAISMRLRLRGA